MDFDGLECTVVSDVGLPFGMVANVAAIMGVSLGERLSEMVGDEVRDVEDNQRTRWQSAVLETVAGEPQASGRQ